MTQFFERLQTVASCGDFLSSEIPFASAVAAQFSVVVECWRTMEILSALKSWSSGKNLTKFESPNLRSPRFRRWGSKRQRRNLPTCRENRASSNSVPNSIYGDSCSDLSVRVNSFRPEDYLDPFQGRKARWFYDICNSSMKFESCLHFVRVIFVLLVLPISKKQNFKSSPPINVWTSWDLIYDLWRLTVILYCVLSQHLTKWQWAQRVDVVILGFYSRQFSQKRF